MLSIVVVTNLVRSLGTIGTQICDEEGEEEGEKEGEVSHGCRLLKTSL